MPSTTPLPSKKALLRALGALLILTGSGVRAPAQALDPLLIESLNTASDRYYALTRYRLAYNAERFTNYTNTAGDWRVQNDSTWTSGFLPGSLWYLYALTGRHQWQLDAQHWDAGVRSRATATDNDTGFQIYDSFGTGLDFGTAIDSADYTSVIHTAAKTLTDERWNATIGAYRAWPQNDSNPTSTPFEVNIDMIMNMELVLWSAANGGPSEYTDHAIAHADISWTDLVRADGSTFHVVEYDGAGNVVRKRTHQGWKRDSTWSRGQAWAVYGYTVLYRYTDLPRMLERAEKTFDYFVAATDAQSSDAIPFSDFDAPLNNDNPRDSSAAAIVASAALELYTLTAKSKYLDRAIAILRSLSQTPYLTEGTRHEALIAKASEKWGEGEVGASFADFYYLESTWRYLNWIFFDLGTWYDYELRPGDVVRSGDWLGDINVRWDPWIYHYGLQNYLWWYHDGTPGDGDWIYIYKPE